jgi:signal transduction histidine kinase
MVAALAHANLSPESTLAELPLFEYQVEAETIVREVEKALRADKTLPGVIITSGGVACGVISRRKFFEHLGQLYGVAIYLRRPIALILKAVGGEAMIKPSVCHIPEVTQQALDRSRLFAFDPIIVDFGRQIYRLLDVYTLLFAQSRLFTNLQLQLKVANEELETRIEQRTAQLVTANTSLTAEVTLRRQAEEELIAAHDQAVAASQFKSELLAKVSHELRTPLGGILGFGEMLQLGIYGALTPPQQELADRIISNTYYLTEMVNQLLDQAKIEAGQLTLVLKPFSPATVLAEAVSKLGLLAENKGLTLTTEIEPDIPAKIRGDAVRVQQILINIAGNALKFTTSGGVHIRLYTLNALYWGLEVADTGPGIPKEAQEFIFEPFKQVDGSITRAHEGTGLGLSIVKQLVELMAGRIHLDSEPGHGSIFAVFLPLHPIGENLE